MPNVPPPVIPPSDEIDARFEAAIALARDAGRMSLNSFDDPALPVDVKRDGSVVTETDRQIEAWLTVAIAERFPDDGVLGEEHGERSGTSDWRWVLDPIDGTRSFVHGVPLYGTLVACEYREQPTIGVIEMPALDERVYAATGGPAIHERAPRESDAPDRVADGCVRSVARCSTTTQVDEAMLCITAFDYYRLAGEEALYHELINRFGHTRGWSDCYAQVLCATGRCDAVIEPDMKPWDVAAGLPITIAAGGVGCAWNGSVSAHHGSAVYAAPGIASEVLAFVRDRAGMTGGA
ncbi:MAG: inositol monophosphatase [Phycisphaerales bacterium]